MPAAGRPARPEESRLQTPLGARGPLAARAARVGSARPSGWRPARRSGAGRCRRSEVSPRPPSNCARERRALLGPVGEDRAQASGRDGVVAWDRTPAPSNRRARRRPPSGSLRPASPRQPSPRRQSQRRASPRKESQQQARRPPVAAARRVEAGDRGNPQGVQGLAGQARSEEQEAGALLLRLAGAPRCGRRPRKEAQGDKTVFVALAEGSKALAKVKTAWPRVGVANAKVDGYLSNKIAAAQQRPGRRRASKSSRPTP